MFLPEGHQRHETDSPTLRPTLRPTLCPRPGGPKDSSPRREPWVHLGYGSPAPAGRQNPLFPDSSAPLGLDLFRASTHGSRRGLSSVGAPHLSNIGVEARSPLPGAPSEETMGRILMFGSAVPLQGTEEDVWIGPRGFTPGFHLLPRWGADTRHAEGDQKVSQGCGFRMYAPVPGYVLITTQGYPLQRRRRTQQRQQTEPPPSILSSCHPVRPLHPVSSEPGSQSAATVLGCHSCATSLPSC
jgi:hypothetical protein